ncbi:hypothetical protein niasHT_021289 [Heterodera trifolii]|uniref:Uncharacterized protein n=1 Tax=Heterodera trifolii TaxID=157864 RepID=A0ABD2JJJ0_9BILA
MKHHPLLKRRMFTQLERIFCCKGNQTAGDVTISPAIQAIPSAATTTESAKTETLLPCIEFARTEANAQLDGQCDSISAKKDKMGANKIGASDNKLVVVKGNHKVDNSSDNSAAAKDDKQLPVAVVDKNLYKMNFFLLFLLLGIIGVESILNKCYGKAQCCRVYEVGTMLERTFQDKLDKCLHGSTYCITTYCSKDPKSFERKFGGYKCSGCTISGKYAGNKDFPVDLPAAKATTKDSKNGGQQKLGD